MNQSDNPIDAMKEQILAEAERLGPDDTFSFRCHAGLPCFNVCCADVNIVLTPYDVLRLKRRLKLTSQEFLQRHTIKPFTKDQKLPVLLLRMDESKDSKPCPFVTEQGCSVYEDRPWPCRMYPVGAASARTERDPVGPEFYFLMKEEPCDGFSEQAPLTIRQWMEEQGATAYDEASQGFKELTLHPRLQQGPPMSPQQMDMFFTACYELERFRSFIFDSSFLEKYDLEPEVVQAIKQDDEQLLSFAFRWLRTCLLGEDLVKLKDATVEQYKERLASQGMRPKP
jgi:Fe-S-cluster containining protein